MEDLLTEGAGVDSDDSVVFNRSIRFPSLAGLFIEVGVCVMSGKERIKKKKNVSGKFINKIKFLVKVFFTV